MKREKTCAISIDFELFYSLDHCFFRTLLIFVLFLVVKFGYSLTNVKCKATLPKES